MTKTSGLGVQLRINHRRALPIGGIEQGLITCRDLSGIDRRPQIILLDALKAALAIGGAHFSRSAPCSAGLLARAQELGGLPRHLRLGQHRQRINHREQQRLVQQIDQKAPAPEEFQCARDFAGGLDRRQLELER